MTIPPGGTRGSLGFHQDLHTGLGAVKAALYREAGGIARALPVMARDGLQMRIADERLKRSHGAVETCQYR